MCETTHESRLERTKSSSNTPHQLQASLSVRSKKIEKMKEKKDFAALYDPSEQNIDL